MLKQKALQHENMPTRPAKHHTLAGYKRDTASLLCVIQTPVVKMVLMVFPTSEKISEISGKDESTSAMNAPKSLQFIDGASACTYELHTLHLKGCDHALHIFDVRAFAHGSSTPYCEYKCGYEPMARTRISS
ncbi:hypothetical protein EVAR_29877_1 [Eumeta japonica]|uniref:Uncharacterized protein n=1 Tax=Eumeta variegata TaxID=151549 RepID=A0A4C1V850_EUMVA|nr:hypothetical protein EVAR_29877_1 [Eumeta japonica]